MHVIFAVRVPIIVILVYRENLTVTFLEFILDQQVEHLLYQCMELKKNSEVFQDGSRNEIWILDTSAGPCSVIISFTENGIVN